MTMVMTMAWRTTRIVMSAGHTTRALRPAWRQVVQKTRSPTAAQGPSIARFAHLLPLFGQPAGSLSDVIKCSTQLLWAALKKGVCPQQSKLPNHSRTYGESERFVQAQREGSEKQLRSRRRPTSSNKRLRRDFQSRKSLAGTQHSISELTGQRLYDQPGRSVHEILQPFW